MFQNRLEYLTFYYSWGKYIFKKACMQDGPRVEKCPTAIQFLATYVIVMDVSNRQTSGHPDRQTESDV